MKKLSRRVRKALRIVCNKELLVARAENSKLEELVSDLKTSIHDMKETIDFMSGREDEYTKQIESLKSDISKYQSTIEELQAAKKEKEATAHDFFEALELKRKQYNELEIELTQVSKVSAERFARALNLEKELDKVKKQRDEANKLLEEKNKTLIKRLFRK